MVNLISRNHKRPDQLVVRLRRFIEHRDQVILKQCSPSVLALSIRGDEWRHVLFENPAGRCFLCLPGLHELSGQLAKLLRVLCGVEGSIELFDLKMLLGRELNTAVHANLHWGVHERYLDGPNFLLPITPFRRVLSVSSLIQIKL